MKSYQCSTVTMIHDLGRHERLARLHRQLLEPHRRRPPRTKHRPEPGRDRCCGLVLAARSPRREGASLAGHLEVEASFEDDERLLSPKGLVNVAVQGRAAANDFFFLREAIASGVGIGPLPWFLARHDLAAGPITRVLPDYRAAGGTSYLVYPPAKPLSPKLAKFCAHLLEHVPSLSAQP